jgi:hypothetical protein
VGNAGKSLVAAGVAADHPTSVLAHVLGSIASTRGPDGLDSVALGPVRMASGQGNSVISGHGYIKACNQ